MGQREILLCDTNEISSDHLHPRLSNTRMRPPLGSSRHVGNLPLTIAEIPPERRATLQ
jgi:hypothetical protein